MILITGFGPFLDVIDNPSADLAARLGEKYQVLEVAYNKVDAFVKEFAASEYDSILCLGVNAKAVKLRYEVYAHNLMGAQPDVSGKSRPGKAIKKGGPQTLGQTLASPIQLLELPMKLSFTPGSYLCNYILYRLLLACPEKKVAFVHVPPFEKVSRKKQLRKINELLEYLEITEEMAKPLAKPLV